MSSRATIEEVASTAGVSRSTVSRVVNGSTAVSPEALLAVQRAIQELSYVPNRAARSLASKQTHAIALIVPEDTTRFFGDPFFAAIVAGITGALRGSDYLLNLLIASDDPGDKMTSFVRNGGVDGALIVSHHTSDAFIERVADAVPVVWGGRPVRLREGDYVVDVDNVAGARVATTHLIDTGRTRIATISGPITMVSSADRVQGFRSALADAGLVPFAEEAGDYSEASGAEAARRILAVGRPDAIFVASDLMARGALTALRAAGIRVPDDVALVGFDDSSVAISTDPPLTTMRQPMYAQGEAMAGVLLSRLAGSDPTHTTILPTELVVRASS
ncbi:LacI family transcriptional regulator [Microbacterium foliorum]|uniref:Ribose operon repressor n=1 Tax=Microbacterium foliorum TaxID=104336 RepID=A0A0F0KH11_9MICO|nr:LacI family DNA-binding transcriptional regulator [Microbacterium foliorum]AXL11058.1 LacI family transcriptional regulator [Microbacterium foliorum]KJL20172.1 Ribose operon repressor [Microbacterium foliorum]CAH0135150.1 Ribose operon repressor [Microbacterium foliorum]CAH0174271.1 Ribose operon repressor [Microbacterium foliorum]